ncbi:hypothetical protein Plhal304r1_c082g0167251 [Plasmopara halstedii]
MLYTLIPSWKPSSNSSRCSRSIGLDLLNRLNVYFIPLKIAVAPECILHLSLNFARILLGALECVQGDAVEDALGASLREVNYMLVFANNLRNNSFAISKNMVAMLE